MDSIPWTEHIYGPPYTQHMDRNIDSIWTTEGQHIDIYGHSIWTGIWTPNSTAECTACKQTGEERRKERMRSRDKRGEKKIERREIQRIERREQK
jgi:hypothetical protein